MSESEQRLPSLGQALLPILLLIGMLAAAVYLFGGDASYGPNQIALILAACVGMIVGLRNGYTWKELHAGIVHGISLATGAMLILLVVGSLIGTWILSGIVPTLIYYGLQVLSPSIFFFAACIVCAVVALATGSSWTTIGTIGIALVGIASVMGLNLGLTAGAAISGAYFGDKMSPLSDTTNLAPAVAGTDLFTHIRHMLWTTGPSITISMIIFLLIGFFATGEAGSPSDIQAIMTALDNTFNIGWYLLIPPGIVIALVIKKMPALPALIVGALLGGVFAMIFQPDVVTNYVGPSDNPHIVVLFQGMWKSLYASFEASTGSAALDDLLNRGGMESMLNTIWLILTAMMFGGVMETTGILQRITASILKIVRSTGSLILATLASCIGMNIVASDQYISIVIPGRMYRAEFERRGLHSKNLSRALEDSGTLTSVLIPWNTCGAFMAGTLGVATLAYLPFCFFNLMNPVISAIYGFTGFTIEKLDPEDATEAAPAPVA